MCRIVILSLFVFTSFIAAGKPEGKSPLSAYSAEWDQPKYAACNTAANTRYLSGNEKQIIYIINLARMNPRLFCKTVVPHAHAISSFVDTTSGYYKSLVTELMSMEPLGILTPDSLCYVSANCHAVTSGKKGYVGHDRQSAECRKKEHFHGECCQYGISDPLGVVIDLLVDQDVESLGHRHNLLGKYKSMSTSIAPHKKYGTVTVIDLW